MGHGQGGWAAWCLLLVAQGVAGAPIQSAAVVNGQVLYTVVGSRAVTVYGGGVVAEGASYPAEVFDVGGQAGILTREGLTVGGKVHPRGAAVHSPYFRGEGTAEVYHVTAGLQWDAGEWRVINSGGGDWVEKYLCGGERLYASAPWNGTQPVCSHYPALRGALQCAAQAAYRPECLVGGDAWGAVHDVLPDFFVSVEGRTVLRSFHRHHGIELWEVSSTTTPPLPLCRELKGGEVHFADLPPLARASLVVEVELLGGDGFVARAESWGIGVTDAGVWLAIYDDIGFEVAVDVPSTTTDSVVVVAPSGVVDCSPLPTQGGVGGKFEVRVGVGSLVNVTRVDAGGGWQSPLTLRCWTAVGGVAAPRIGLNWMRVKWECTPTACSVRHNEVLIGTSSNLTHAVVPMEEVVVGGRLVEGVVDRFTGEIRAVRVNGRCLLPNGMTAEDGGCRPPDITISSGGNASALAAVDGSEAVLLSGGWVEYRWPDPATVSEVRWACNTSFACPTGGVLKYHSGGVWIDAQDLGGNGAEEHTVGGFRGLPAALRWRVDFGASPLALDMLTVVAACGRPDLHLVADIFPGSGSSNPLGGALLRGELYFLASPDSEVHHIYRYAPRHGGVSVVSTAFPQRFHAAVAPAVPESVSLHFAGAVLWGVQGGILATDGTAAGTAFHPVRLLDVRGGRVPMVKISDDAVFGSKVVVFCGEGELCTVQVVSSLQVVVSRSPSARGRLAAPIPGSHPPAVLLSRPKDPRRPVPFYRGSALSSIGSLQDIAQGGSIAPTADTFIDTASPTAIHGAARTLVISSDGKRAAYLRFSGVPSTASGVALLLYGRATSWAGGSVGCSHLLVDLIDPTWVWDEESLTGSTADPPVLDTEVFSIPNARRAMHIDIDAVLVKRAAVAEVQLRVRLDAANCSAEGVPHVLEVDSREVNHPDRRPRLFMQKNARAGLFGSGGRFFSLLPSTVRTTDWLHASCGGATVRFQLGDDALRYLQTGGHSAGWVGLRDVQVVTGSVDPLPTHMWAGAPDGPFAGHVRIASERSTFLSTVPEHDPGCNGRSPTASDVVELLYTTEEDSDIVTLALCDPGVCEPSGGVCDGFVCKCPQHMVGSSGACECAADWHGPSCALFCSESTTCSGRGFCTADGNCECEAGWGGASCNEGLSCRDLEGLVGPNAVDCTHLPDGNMVAPEELAADRWTQSPIDRCVACPTEELMMVDGRPRYVCRSP